MKSGYLPIRKSVSEIPEFKVYLDEHPNFKVFVDQMAFSQAERPIDYGGIEINRHIAETIEKATVGKMDVRQALNDGVRRSQQVLESTKKAKQ
jgi:ABC-type glycerol-3-phosphate transport system substrate-binding protein